MGGLIQTEIATFLFGVRMPMLYVIQHGGNFVPEATSPEDMYI